MNSETEISKESFMELSTEDIRRIVREKNRPQVGIFVADGNRRLVMCRTGLSPTSDEFYKEYARFFIDSLKRALSIFFDHGLHTLFFPLFGPSLLLRQNKFQMITIPAAYRKMFRSAEWLQFYKEMGIRVKAYGNLSKLEKIDVNHLNMVDGIKQLIEDTAAHAKHTLFFGFMSENTPGLEMPQMIIDFYKSKNRTPTPREMMEIYYGETVPSADFIILSDKLSAQGPLPPFIPTQKAKIYYFPVPGFLGLNTQNYRQILYDLLFTQPQDSVREYPDKAVNDIQFLDKFYRRHENTVIGIGKKIGTFLVTGI